MNLEYLLTTFSGTIHFAPLQSLCLYVGKPAMSTSIMINTKLAINLSITICNESPSLTAQRGTVELLPFTLSLPVLAPRADS